MNITLKIWRQAGPNQPGKLVAYPVNDISSDVSFLEMLDVLNENLIKKGELPVTFESDCREGICGTCGIMINGQAHGPELGAATCQLHMRSFKDGDTLVLEPWRARMFPVIKDLMVDRSALDRIIAVGGYTSAKTGRHIDANGILIGHETAEAAMDAASCIGCGACVAACPNASASLFTSAKITQLAQLPQGQVERIVRGARMVEQMDIELSGGCTNIGECYAACPKEISLETIATMKREYFLSFREA
ncbi:MAG: succinate dehydrogenase/fumarate reductase iron-sulfur subunit, partial [Deltaproteobacteria bacterium]|nr:succinate dehydrogenase/fumarate reductase iron-sulfur subunit [Deltaproteobacteria bacterium]